MFTTYGPKSHSEPQTAYSIPQITSPSFYNTITHMAYSLFMHQNHGIPSGKQRSFIDMSPSYSVVTTSLEQPERVPNISLIALPCSQAVGTVVVEDTRTVVQIQVLIAVIFITSLSLSSLSLETVKTTADGYRSEGTSFCRFQSSRRAVSTEKQKKQTNTRTTSPLPLYIILQP